MAWCEVARWRGWKISDLLIMVPNGAYLGADAKKRAQTMARLKRSGFRNGVFDYLLPVPIWSRTAIPPEILTPGLWLELKRTIGGRSSEDQAEFQGQMELFGWKCVVAKGRDQAVQAITEYLALSGDKITIGWDPHRRTDL